jgi:hypothetical protein
VSAKPTHLPRGFNIDNPAHQVAYLEAYERGYTIVDVEHDSDHVVFRLVPNDTVFGVAQVSHEALRTLGSVATAMEEVARQMDRVRRGPDNEVVTCIRETERELRERWLRQRAT